MSSFESSSGNQRRQHGSDLVQLTRDLCGKSELTDVTLACAGGVTFQAHRLVLAGASSCFRSMFAGVSDGWKHPMIFMKDVQPSDMECLLQFIYRGEINVHADYLLSLDDLIKMAKALGIKGLEEALRVAVTKTPSLLPDDSKLSVGVGEQLLSLKEANDAEVLIQTGNLGEVSPGVHDKEYFDDGGEIIDEEDMEDLEVESSGFANHGMDDNEFEEDVKEEDVEEEAATHPKVFYGDDDGDNSVEILESTKRKHMLAMNGFQYFRGKRYLSHIAWRCTVRRCKGLLTSDHHCLQAQLKTGHHHPPDRLRTERIKALTRLRQVVTVSSSAVGPSELLQDFMAEVPDDVRAVLPMKESLLRTVRAIQNKSRLPIEQDVEQEPQHKEEQEEREIFTGEADGDNSLELLESTKGHDLLAMNGFRYSRAKQGLGHQSWRCAVKKCRGRLETDLHCLQAELKAGHHHPPDRLRTERVKAFNRLKQVAVSSGLRPSDVLNEFLSKLSAEVLAILPAKETLLKHIYMVRKKSALEEKAKIGK